MQDWQLLPKKLNHADNALKGALLVSSIIHLALFLILPDFRPHPGKKPKPRLIPVELVTIRVKKKPVPIRKKTSRKKKPVPPKPKPAPKSKKPAPKPKQAKGNYRALVNRHVKDLSQHYQPQISLPEIPLPQTVSQDLPELTIPQSEDLFSPDDIFADIGAPPLDEPEKITTPVSQPGDSPQGPSDSPAGIEWRGTPRKTLYQPPLPRISSMVEGDIQLKFWVDRDGMISQMIPLKKLDAKVESVAFEYLKKWRFERLPAGVDHLQWGIITLKIRLK